MARPGRDGGVQIYLIPFPSVYVISSPANQVVNRWGDSVVLAVLVVFGGFAGLGVFFCRIFKMI